MTAAPRASAESRRAFGVVLVIAAGTIWSVAGPLVRAIEAADVWQILFFKSLWMTVTLGGAFLVRHRASSLVVLRASGRWVLIGGLCIAGGSSGWILSITTTTVANTLLLQAAGPFVAALLAWAVLGERTGASTWVAMTVAMAGVAVMVGDGALDGRLFGNIAGVGAVIAFGGFAVSLRAARLFDMTPALCLGGLIAMAVAAGMADDLAIGPYDHGVCFVMGSLETGLGLMLFTIGARYVPAGELVLLSLIEVFLGPVIVWAVFGEVPSLGTLAGGTLIIAAIAGQAMRVLLRGAPAAPVG